MGLDVTAYERLIPADDDLPDDDIAITGGEIADSEKEWPGSTKGLPVQDLMMASGSVCRTFKAGSYSGFGDWRAELCRLIHKVEPFVLWENRETMAGRPFFELINFSDCEGVIGPLVSAKLAQDFADYQDEAAAFGNAWFSERYTRWRHAFELASGNGAVRFH